MADPAAGVEEEIALTIRIEGERVITVNRAEYEAAKAAGEVAHFLDADLSDFDGRNIVVEPDGRSYNPHDQPHGPDGTPADPFPEELLAAFEEALKGVPAEGLTVIQIRKRLPDQIVDKYAMSAEGGGMDDVLAALEKLRIVDWLPRPTGRGPMRYIWCGPKCGNWRGCTCRHGCDIP